MARESKVIYDRTTRQGLNLEQIIPFRDKIFKALVDTDEDLQTQIDNITSVGTGDVVGPASAIDDDIAVYDGTTGKLIKDGGYTIADLLLTAVQDVFEGALHVNAATTGVLAGSPTYANGASGVGATLTRGSNGVFPTIDGVTAIVGRRYLVKNQASQLQNGVYELTTLGSAGTPWILTRTTDSDLNTEFDAQVVVVGAGTTNIRKVFSQTTSLPITIGTTSIIYAQTAAATGIGVPLSRTVAQMQTLVAANGLNPGRAYIITNVGSGTGCTCSAMFIATSNSTISTTGWGQILNPAMSTAEPCKIEYILSIDTVVNIYIPRTLVEVSFGNHVTVLGTWPFDSNTIKRGKVMEPQTAPNTGTIMEDFFCAGNNVFSTSASSVFSGFMESYAALTLSGTARFNGFIGSNSVVALKGTQIIENAKIGSGCIFDLSSCKSDYADTGKTYEIGNSDFVCNEIIDLAGTVVFDITSISGNDFSFCGIFTNVTNSLGPTTIVTLTTNDTNHPYIFYNADSSSIKFGVGDNIGTQGSVSFDTAVAGDSFGCNYNPIITKWCQNGNSFTQ